MAIFLNVRDSIAQFANFSYTRTPFRIMISLSCIREAIRQNHKCFKLTGLWARNKQPFGGRTMLAASLFFTPDTVL